MQRFCDGCRRPHELEAFDLDSDEANSICRAHARRRDRMARLSSRRLQQSKIEALEQQRRSLIAALVKIDQEIARERAARASSPLFKRAAVGDVFGADGDLDRGD